MTSTERGECKKVRLLHLCSYFIGSKVYCGLFNALHNQGYVQDVYVPIRYGCQKGVNAENLVSDIGIQYAYLLKKYHRILFRTKYKAVYDDLERRSTALDADLLHAHSLCSDGSVALEVFRRRAIPYVVTVRNTDINFFCKYFVHLRPLFRNIVLGAGKIIFLSPAYETKLFDLLGLSTHDELLKKVVTLPSGISAFWHNNLFFREGLVASDVVQILFVGRLDRNKNIKSVVAACDQLYQEGVGVELHIVGDGPLKRWLMDKISTVDFIKYAGPLYSNEALMDAYRAAHVLVVPSFKETFGLVYPEALSQGLPIIFSAGEGFDGWFNSGEVGYAVDPYSIESIKVAIVKILSLYGTLSRNATEKSSLFDWGPISNEYNKLYSSLIDGLPI